MAGFAGAVPADREGTGLVVPRNAVEVEQESELTLAVVGEGDLAGPGAELFAQFAPAFTSGA